MTDFWKHTEGRRLEFKGEMPAHSDLAKTVVAFANDAGGDIYIRIHIYKGSTPPYYIKQDGKLKGTYIRVGSNNRVADESIIADLERKRRNISFDSEIVLDKPFTSLDFNGFIDLFEEKTGEDLNVQTLRKLELIREEQGTGYPTNALVLFSDDDLRRSLFPNAKIECARFKGVSAEDFIDQKTIDCNIGLQAEEAYNFVLRHINKGATVEGVYTVSRWEYPVKAIREIIVGDNVGDNVGDGSTKESQILSMISQDSGISATVIAKRLGITKRHCERIIAKMKSDGLISREGSAKNGNWIITKTDK